MVRVRGGFGCLVTLVAVILISSRPPPQRSPAKRGGAGGADLFVLGNTVFILYHGWLRTYRPARLACPGGREEDAADNLASIMMIPEQADRHDGRVDHSRCRWMVSSATFGSRKPVTRNPTWWGEHALDMQRFYSVVCLMYGSDPSRLHRPCRQRQPAIGPTHDLPERLRPSPRGMDPPAVSPYEPGRVACRTRQQDLALNSSAPDPVYGYVASLLHESGLINAIARDIGTSFKLPGDLTIRFRNCGADTANAFYDKAGPAVTMCYELSHSITN